MTGGVATMLWVLWDVAAVCVLGLSVWMGAARGFVRTLVSFVGYIAALVAAYSLAPAAAEVLYNHVVRQVLRWVLLGRLEDAVAVGGDLLSEVPDSLRRLMEGDTLTSAALGGELSGVVDLLIDAALQQPVMSVLQGLSFLVIFALAVVVVRLVSRLFSGVAALPVLGELDMVLGGVLGVVQGGVVLVVAALVAHLVLAFSGGGYAWLNEQVMEDTYVFRVFWHLFAQ